MGTFLIIDIYKITGLGPILVGKVETGYLHIGMKAKIENVTLEIKTMEMNHQVVKSAKENDKLGMTLNCVFDENRTKKETSFLKSLFIKKPDAHNILKEYISKTIEFN